MLSTCLQQKMFKNMPDNECNYVRDIQNVITVMCPKDLYAICSMKLHAFNVQSALMTSVHIIC